MYISYNDGANWYPFQINLPIVPITDMTIKNNDLILATQGRGFWILDDISALQEMNNEIKQKPFHVYTIRDSYRIGGYQIENPVNAGKNPKPGLVINYFIPSKPGSPNEPDSGKVLSIELYDNNNKLINTYSSNATDKNEKLEFQLN